MEFFFPEQYCISLSLKTRLKKRLFFLTARSSLFMPQISIPIPFIMIIDINTAASVPQEKRL
jgi:hypothetical protein